MKISIVICTYNRAESLRRTLQSIGAMSVPGDLLWEVIVVDNNSRDHTREVTEEFGATSGLEVAYAFEREQGLSHARNRGISEAGGEIVSFIDDDVIVDEDWLVNLLEAFTRYNPAVVGGKVLLQGEMPFPGWFSSSMSGSLGAFDRGDNIIFADIQYRGLIGIGANMSFKREIFEKIGSFRTDLGRKGNSLVMGEETELYWRIRNHGGKCMYYPSAAVYHCIDSKKMSKKYIRRWFYNIGEWGYFSDMVLFGDTGGTILGIPRAKYRVAFKSLLGLAWYTLRSSKADAFAKEVSIISFLGYCAKRIKTFLPTEKM